MYFKLKRFLIPIFSLLLMTNAISVFANEVETKKDSMEGKSFNIKEMIFEHVLDAYEWHVLTVDEHHYSIPLPIIVKSADKGWNVFCSSKLHHGHESYNGFYISQEEKYKGKIVEKNAQGEEVRPLDLSLTKNAFSILISSLLLVVILLYVSSLYRKNPLRSMKGFPGAIEQLVMSINDDVIKPGVGENYKKFAPYLLTVFFFIFFNNLLGLIPIFPGGANITGNIAVTFVLAIITFLITNFSGNKKYWKEIFWPDVPVFLKTPVFPLMQIIEIIGVFTKPFALMIRLFANMLAGHMVVLVFMGLIFIFGAISAVAGFGVSVVSMLFTIFMLILDVLISFIQAYVFTMLSSIFIGLSSPEHHSEH
ncbi:MAG: F0F1 ATP synthase subunit A [Paludibacteraceae bacterium]